MMRAMVFAAGLGTRLRPLTLERPKPAVPVGNRCLASFAVEHLGRAGATQVVLNGFHLAEALEEALGQTSAEVALPPWRIVRETTLLGTAGGLRNAWSMLGPQNGTRDGAEDGSPVVVMNGDILFAPDLARAVAYHEASGAVATMVVRADPRAFELGAVEVAHEGPGVGWVRRLVGLPRELPRGIEVAPYMFTGVHILAPRALESLPAAGCIIRTAYRSWLAEGEVVSAVVDAAPWRDLGTLESYLEANLDLAAGRLPWASLAVSDGSLVHGPAQVDASATVRSSVVGARAVVDRGVTLDRVVVWDGARVERSVSNAVVTPNGVVPVPLR
jgi:mannose-1-phosphate guanylyltransferase